MTTANQHQHNEQASARITDRELTANELAHVSGGRKSGGGQSATGAMFLRFDFKMVAVLLELCARSGPAIGEAERAKLDQVGSTRSRTNFVLVQASSSQGASPMMQG